MKNLNLVKKKEANKYFERNKNHFEKNLIDEKIISLIKDNRLRAKNILEIGCANGNKLQQYAKLCKSKKIYGVDLSNKAIKDGKTKQEMKLL